MTSGIGNPDWQRRYTFSAAPIATSTLTDTVTNNSGILDENGYEYLILNIDASASLAFLHVTVNFYSDSAGVNLVAGVDFTLAPQMAGSLKIPASTRYYIIVVSPVGGTTGHNVTFTVYGTNGDYIDTLTGITSVPLAAINASLAAGATQTAALKFTTPGRAMITVNHATNNKYTAWLEYYDNDARNWIIYYNIHGTDHGMAFTEQVWLPWAPVRANMRNDDTVAQTSQLYMITANIP